MSGKPAAKSVANQTKYVFDQYTDNMEVYDASDISHLFADDFDRGPHDFIWARHDKLEETQKRYYRVVRKETHGHMFKEDAFHPIHNVVGSGFEFMGRESGGIPELYLCEREMAAKEAEVEQMLAASKRRQDPEANEKLKAIREKMGNAIGTQNIRGGITTSTTGWGK